MGKVSIYNLTVILGSFGSYLSVLSRAIPERGCKKSREDHAIDDEGQHRMSPNRNDTLLRVYGE